MKFTKMHGCGNDYIYVNCFEETVENPKEVAVKVSDRHFGISSDGLILICPSDVADVKMRMFNADGSEGKMCGNGIRCVAKYSYDFGLVDKETITVETLSGIKTLDLQTEQGKVKTVTVDMGSPILNPEQIPVRFDGMRLLPPGKKYLPDQLWRHRSPEPGNRNAVEESKISAGIILLSRSVCFGGSQRVSQTQGQHSGRDRDRRI